MEVAVNIDLLGNNRISGVLWKTGRADNLIVFVHGLASHGNEHIFFNGSRFFADRDFDSFRFNFYGDSGSARNFSDSLLAILAGDLNSVVDYFRGSYANLHIVAHSLGCPLTLIAGLRGIATITFWEPSQQPQNIFRQADFCPAANMYIMRAQVDYVLNPEVVREARDFPSIKDLLKGVATPIKVITASGGAFEIGRDLYFANANHPKAFHNIPNSDHCFDRFEAEAELFKETFEWVARN